MLRRSSMGASGWAWAVDTAHSFPASPVLEEGLDPPGARASSGAPVVGNDVLPRRGHGGERLAGADLAFGRHSSRSLDREDEVLQRRVERPVERVEPVLRV